MEAFQDIREARCTHVRLSELHNAALVTLPPGEDRTMRDAAMKLSLDADADWDDTRLRAQWEEIGEVFGYNALEAAEDWWIKWGSIGDSAKVASFQEPIGLLFAVTKIDVEVTN
jgi:salicylate hydroxylase